jgi:hypothetical protein
MRLFLVGWTVLLALGFMGLVARGPALEPEGIQARTPTKPAKESAPKPKPEETRASAPTPKPSANDIINPKHLELLQESINYGGYNCPRIISASFTHEDSRGLNFSVGCSTGIFRVTANRAGRVTAVTCRMLC